MADLLLLLGVAAFVLAVLLVALRRTGGGNG